MEDTEDIIDFANTMLGEDLDADLALQMAENAKNLVEGARQWRMLVKEDSTKTFGPADTYLTEKALPTDFLMEKKVVLGIEADDDYCEYDPIQYEERRLMKDRPVYYINSADNKIGICDSVSKTYTIFLQYIKTTPALTLATAPVWPARFWPIISYLMVELQKTGIDYDDINVNQALAHNKNAAMLFAQMIEWDDQIALKAKNNRAGIRRDRNANRTNFIKD